MSGHTKGPWEVTESGHTLEVMQEDGPSVAVILDGGGHKGEDIANARLIAAAPDLFHAAIVTYGAMKRQLDDEGFAPGHWGDDEHEAFGMLKAAIAKAEGR